MAIPRNLANFAAGIDASGNVGVGATPSAWNASWRAVQVGSRVNLTTNGTDAIFANNAYNAGASWVYQNTSTSQLYLQGSGQHVWYNAPSGTAGTNITYTQAMTLDASGRLLVGTTSGASGVGLLQVGQSAPNNAVAVVGTSDVNRTSLLLTNFTGVQSNNKVVVGFDSSGRGGFEVGMPAATNAFYIYDTLAATERVRIDSSGNVGIGTTSPGSRLDISGANAGSVLSSRILNTSTSASSDAQQFIYVNSGTAGDPYTTWTVGGVTSWSAGIRNSDSDNWYLSPGSSLGTSPTLTATTSGNVGIGTSSPAARIHAYGTSGAVTVIAEGATTNSAYGRFEMRGRPAGAGQSAGYIVAASTAGGQAATNIGTIDFAQEGASGNASFMAFSAHNGTSLGERARITSGGNLLVGTTSDFSGARVVTSGGGIGILNRGLLRSSVDGVLQVSADPNNAYGSSYIGFDVDGVENARVTSNGFFGIGTSSPSAKLHVYGTNPALRVQGDGNSYYPEIRLDGLFGTMWLSTYYGATITSGNTSGDNPITFRTGGTVSGGAYAGTEVGRFSGNGYFKSSNTGSYNGGASENEFSNSASGSHILGLYNSNASPFGVSIRYTSAAPNAPSNYFLLCSDNSANRLFIYSNGNVGNANNSYGAISDIKLKENITDATPKLASLNQLRVVNYNLKGDNLKQIGLIAQEVEQVFPGLVETSPDMVEVTKTRTVEVPAVLDEQGNEVTPATTREETYTEREPNGEATKSVKYSVLVPMLLKAVQELTAMNDELRQRVAALEAK